MLRRRLTYLLVALSCCVAALGVADPIAHPHTARPTSDRTPAEVTPRTLDEDRIEVAPRTSMTAARASIAAAGGRVELEAGGRLQVVLPRSARAAIEASPDLEVLAPAIFVPLETAPVTAPAAVLMGVDRWRTAGFTGHRVKVAIVDTGFDGYQEALGTALPRQVVAKSFRADGRLTGSDHGRRAAEVIASIAPNATLYLVNFSTVTELNAAVDYLIAERVDVVSFSLGYVHNGFGDGSGAVNDAVRRGTSAGQAWAVAAGNWAQQHWTGPYVDSDRDGIHEFATGRPTNTHTFVQGDLITVSLRWNEPPGKACTDYDLELRGPDGSLIRASRSIQNCNQDPLESIQVLATQAGTYSVRIPGPVGGTGRLLDLLFVGSPDRGLPLELSVAAGSLAAPADNGSVLSVGALGPTLQSEAGYSSRGPTADGRFKPNVLAPAAGAVGGTFTGTSAAAPHAAGALALLQEAFPRAAREALTGLILGRAAGVTLAPGDSGAGRIDLGSVAGLDPLLPTGAEASALLGVRPPGSGLALMVYRGPSAYPLRFTHLLLDGRPISAIYQFDGTAQTWRVYVTGAPAFVNTVDLIANGAIVLVRFA
jgi:subtilisin family serine protease